MTLLRTKRIQEDITILQKDKTSSAMLRKDIFCSSEQWNYFTVISCNLLNTNIKTSVLHLRGLNGPTFFRKVL